MCIGIIGEDIDAIIRKIQEEVSATVIPVYCDGFKSKVWASDMMDHSKVS